MSARARGELRGVHVLWMVLAFFAAVIAIDVGFSIVAVRTFPGEEETHAFAQGLHYNEFLAERRAGEALGWSATVALGAQGENAVLDIAMIDRAGHPLSGLDFQAELRRPIDADLDRALHFQNLGGGRYRAVIGALHEGQWRLRAEARDRAGHRLDFERSLEWRMR
jgi:nitrogen fixation protein FixH